jgi:hypothetical protein
MTANQGRSASGGNTRSAPVARTSPPATTTVYDDVARVLRHRGWVKGESRLGDATCFVAAIDAAVGVGDPTRGESEARKLARAGRVGAHLRDLLNIRNLAAWSDEPSRTIDELLELLSDAALAFPDD